MSVRATAATYAASARRKKASVGDRGTPGLRATAATTNILPRRTMTLGFNLARRLAVDQLLARKPRI